ncbi:MAG: isoprenylcysteine carboxylmethyltransferase family protein [Thermoanaerobaculum sp.]|nr:isoprenylcysteine carboxylmethyltransferase family protein [Thermoanaerobaculum sp.]MDW7966847.1 isoprenylcysteine carboxylmethyltransferase family protein [Thermoanaerobaculum sp.]
MALVLLGLLLLLGGARQLGRALTVFPVPKANAVLRTSGLYRRVRHPMYAGAVLTFLGWSWWWGSWMAALWCVVVFWFFDRKAAAEEHWLLQRFPEYEAYRRRVSKFLPGIY